MIAATVLFALALADVDFNQQLGAVNQKFQTAVQGMVERDRVKHGLVGATVAVVVDGKLVAAVAVGVRKSGSPEPLLVTDPMHVASNTKGMTALLVGRLVEKGRQRFDQPLRSAFPFPVSSDFGAVPLIELLYQRSGITDQSAPQVQDPRYGPSDPAQRSRAAPTAYSEKRQLFAKDCLSGNAGYAPGSKHTYSNANYIVAGAAAEVAAGGTPWEELMKAEVFAPLHMKSAGFGPMGSGQGVDTPWQHESKGVEWNPLYHDNPRFMGPAGSVYCSALDLANYAQARVLGAYGRSTYLSASTWRILQTPPENSSYACGIATSGPDANGIRDMSHGGNNNLSSSDWWVREHGRIIVVAMTNCPTSDGIKAILDDVLALTKSW